MVPADPRLLELAQYGIEVGVLDTPCEVLRFFERPSRFLVLRHEYNAMRREEQSA